MTASSIVAYFEYYALEKYDAIAFIVLVAAALIGAIVVSGYHRSLQTTAIVIRDRLYVNTGSSLFAGKETFDKSEETSSSSEEPTVSAIYIHPVKSVCPVSVQSATVDQKGFVGDRRFMVVTPRPLPIWKNKFDQEDWTHRLVTQAVCPSLATIVADLDSEKNVMTLTCKPLDISVTISTRPQSNAAPKYRAKLWDDEVLVQDLGGEVAAFLGKVLQRDTTISDQWKRAGARLVAQAKEDTRTACEFYTPHRARNILGRPPPLACQDDFPFLITTQASLDDLNRRLEANGHDAVPMSRFRPNIVIKGTNAPFEEDKWKVISIGGALFHVVKGCSRCKVTTIDSTTTLDKIPKVGQQPLLELLGEFRVKTSNAKHIYFGQYAIPVSGSIGKTISVGSRVKIMYRGDPTWADPDDSD